MLWFFFGRMSDFHRRFLFFYFFILVLVGCCDVEHYLGDNNSAMNFIKGTELIMVLRGIVRRTGPRKFN